MPKLIKNGSVVSNSWLTIEKDQSLEETLANNASDLIVPAQLWLANKAELQQSGKKIAVWLDSDETASMLVDDIDSLDLIALNFPKFVDGRGYSTAVKLRHHLQYKGELRAIGDILRDQLSYLKRCGFDSFDVSDEVSEEIALGGFEDFSDNYQSTIEKPEPIFKRRN